MATSINSLVPERLRRIWWYATDPKWRRDYCAMQQRVRSLQEQQTKAFRLIWEQTQGVVAAGPFQGLVYLGTNDGIYPQKLLGTYEKELWPVVEEILCRDNSLIVVVGAAEGFYICGLAKRIPKARVIGFESQVALHPRIRELARRNDVLDRIECRGLCDALDLQAALREGQRTLVVCDAEGAEDDLLNPELIAALRNADLLIEVHDHLRPGVGARLLRRLAPTHDVQTVPCAVRELSDVPTSIKLPDDLALAALNESRHPECKWFVCWAHR